MTFKSPTRPRCRCCGKLMPKATSNIWFHVKDPNVTPGRNTGSVYVDALPRTRAEAQKHTNLQVISIAQDEGGIWRAGTWDGETWVDDLFCTVKCAERFGRMAATYRPELHTEAYAKALKEPA